MRLAHIVNPVAVPQTSDLFLAQPITFESMRLAQAFSQPRVEVSLFSAQFAEDLDQVPSWLTTTGHLSRSILDISGIANGKKLPLIVDILDRLYEASTADYFIYTNVDIALMPFFYVAVADLIDTGCDALVINRRTIPPATSYSNHLGLMFAEMGKPHPGHDCFVFRRDVYPKYLLGSTCIGADGVGRLLLCNLACHAHNFREMRECHLTFHLGDDRAWSHGKHSPYNEHNEIEIFSALASLESLYGPFENDSDLQQYIQEYREYRLSMAPSEHADQTSVSDCSSSNSHLLGRLRRLATDTLWRNMKHNDH